MHWRLADNILLVVEEICAVDQMLFGHSILLDAECAEGLRSQLLMLTWIVVY